MIQSGVILKAFIFSRFNICCILLVIWWERLLCKRLKCLECIRVEDAEEINEDTNLNIRYDVLYVNDALM